jgi:hypothetical protein
MKQCRGVNQKGRGWLQVEASKAVMMEEPKSGRRQWSNVLTQEGEQ